MSCTIAISNSPVFSPSRISSSLFYKSSLSSSPDKALNINHSPSSSSSTPSLPLRLLRLQKPPSGLNRESGDVVVSNSSSPTLLKRKRPARLDIPISCVGFAGPATPAVDGTQVTEVDGDGYSVCCKRGRREAMEDRYSAVVNLQGDPKQAFFGIFDGHGGAKAAEFAAENLNKNILNEVGRRGGQELEEAVKFGYLNTDSEFLKEDIHGGSCCVTALIRKGQLVVSNAGDCRAVMSRGGVAEALTSDHRPSRDDEKDRIENLGGFVDCCHGVWRIQGSLAVSRGIGDGHLKQWVTAEPETKILRIEPVYEFLILASDGLWEKVTNQEAVDIARPLCVGIQKPELLSACRKLAALSVSRGSKDDISVMLIQLGRFY
ncbi:Protein like [Actinidia chinensis var. chinensis]|uniref:protein-serine/threonine phosphatase n=1 Tax=Actinidia chinensis var. chinensis TaxID=1590841 RepID=A0A2R6QJB5_ACTCC|nr:Protein like [Actinidia chinensis var. chinensis]